MNGDPHTLLDAGKAAKFGQKIPKPMKEAEIAGYILEHDARNLQLRRRLAERGLDGRSVCWISCRFPAASRQHARQLAQNLRQAGWRQITEQMVRKAAPAECS
jgi:hypothetical protein